MAEERPSGVNIPNIPVLTACILEVEPEMHNFLNLIITLTAYLHHRALVNIMRSYWTSGESEWTQSDTRYEWGLSVREAKILYRYNERTYQ